MPQINAFLRQRIDEKAPLADTEAVLFKIAGYPQAQTEVGGEEGDDQSVASEEAGAAARSEAHARTEASDNA